MLSRSVVSRGIFPKGWGKNQNFYFKRIQDLFILLLHQFVNVTKHFLPNN